MNAFQKKSSKTPKDQLKFVPFTERLEDFLEYHNDIDFCIDTYPYSGTTTTCSALYMGTPTYTLLGDNHISRVSSSIFTHIGLSEYVCDNAKMYINKIINHKTCSKKYIRQTFMDYMNPNEFMAEYETKLIDRLNLES